MTSSNIYMNDFLINVILGIFFHTTYFSMIMVTGPLFKRLTFISAPNMPFSTDILFFWHSSQKYSYSCLASSGFSACINEGLFQ